MPTPENNIDKQVKINELEAKLTGALAPNKGDEGPLRELQSTLEKHTLPKPYFAPQAQPKLQPTHEVSTQLLGALETLIAYCKQSPLPPIMATTIEEATTLLLELKQSQQEKHLVRFI